VNLVLGKDSRLDSSAQSFDGFLIERCRSSSDTTAACESDTLRGGTNLVVDAAATLAMGVVM